MECNKFYTMFFEIFYCQNRAFTSVPLYAIKRVLKNKVTLIRKLINLVLSDFSLINYSSVSKSDQLLLNYNQIIKIFYLDELKK